MPNRWVLAGGTVIDGTGSPAVLAGVSIEGERIADIGRVSESGDVCRVDCSGSVIAPGFIDGHSHSDLQVIEGRREKVVQGVTTEVIGNCGFSAYPPAQDAAALREFADGIFCGSGAWGWPSTEAYLRDIARSSTANVVSLVGHGTLRIAVAGNGQGRLPQTDVRRMEELLEQAFQAGAAGFSTGLMYAPGSSAPLDELERLCRVVARQGKIYASHIRSYFADLVPAIEEQIELARRTGCRLQISHLQAVGAANWPEHTRALETIGRAREKGIDVAFDCYPYVAGSSVLTQLLPQWALDGGLSAMQARLSDPATYRRIAREVASTIAWRWADIFVSAVRSQANAGLVGLNLQQIADKRARDPVDALLDILVEERGEANMISFNQSEENLRLSLTHPLATVISDGFYVKGRPHPRLYGTFPYLLGEICRTRGWLTFEAAIRKVTSQAAERFNIRDRGTIERRKWADLVVFDPAQVGSPATYENPEAPPRGIKYVFRNGELLYSDAAIQAG